MYSIPYQLLKYCGQIKQVKRAGWLRYLSEDKVESVADHSYRVGILALLMQYDPSIDSNKCSQIGLIHDLAESVVGDLTPYDKVSKEEKHQMEEDAIKKILSELPENIKQNLLQLWYEYENGSTKEGLIVKDLDKFEMMLQAYEYEEKYNINLEEFFSCLGKLKNPMIKQWAQEIYNKRSQKK